MTDSKKPRWSLAKIALTILFWCLAASMTYVGFRLSKQRAAVTKENSAIVAEVTAIREEVQLLKSLRSESKAGEDLTKEMVSLCREAVDVPEFKSWVVSSSRGGNHLYFFVPEGKHWLNVTVSTPNDSLKNPLPFRSLERKRIRLQPNSGYKFEIIRQARKGPISWRLESNAASFETVEEQLPYRAQWSGRSWGSNEKIAFPNQFRSNRLYGWDDPDHHQLFNSTYRGRVGKSDLQVEVSFQVSLLSATPSVVAASEVAGIRRFHEEGIVGDYLGAGRYVVNEKALAAYHQRKQKQ
ncbi:MAG: hypothetical protein AAFU85_17280 [Planctomycetota bacterium]